MRGDEFMIKSAPGQPLGKLVKSDGFVYEVEDPKLHDRKKRCDSPQFLSAHNKGREVNRRHSKGA